MKALTLSRMLSRGLFILAGFALVFLAGLSFVTDMPLAVMLNWAQKMFGWSFVGLFSMLLALGVIAACKLRDTGRASLWFEVGQHAANGIATLALTFTLLGISLGIGSLSEQTLSPETIQNIIGDMTRQFSMAFMTTVVGLPAASFIRAWVGIQYQTTLTYQEISQ